MDAASQVKKLGTILGVWAHPDDEIFTCGGLMSMAAKQGQKVHCFTATRGEAGVQDESRWPAEQLGQIRTKELEDAYEQLGTISHCWGDLPDGGLTDTDWQKGFELIEQCMQHCQPDSIITFGPDGLTGHPDHQRVSKWATTIGQQNNIPVYQVVLTPESYSASQTADQQFDMFFNIDQPPILPRESCDLCIDLPDDALDAKCAALKAMPSQTKRLFDAFGGGDMQAMYKTESFVLAE